MGDGVGRAMYIDFEDEPVQTLNRLFLLGADKEMIRHQFTYVRPEAPLAAMQKNRWGQDSTTDSGARDLALFNQAVADADPTLIVADGMTVLYGLHGLDSNDAVSTDVITTWLKSLTENGRRTVIVIDHTGKSPERGSLPIGSQHKVSMVQGTLLQVWPVDQPMPGAVGKMELIVVKDRPGEVRKVSEKSGKKAQIAATVTLDSTDQNEDESRRRSYMTITPYTPATPTDTFNVDFSTTSKAGEEARRRETAEENVCLLAFRGDLGRRLSSREVHTWLDANGHKLTYDEVRNALRRLEEGKRGQDVRVRSEGRGAAFRWMLDDAVVVFAPGDAVRPADASEDAPGVVVAGSPLEPVSGASVNDGGTPVPSVVPLSQQEKMERFLVDYAAMAGALDDEGNPVNRARVLSERYGVAEATLHRWLRRAEAAEEPAE
jgi:hypothetical protein